MMDTNQLRIGNWVCYKNNTHLQAQVTAIGARTIYTDLSSEYDEDYSPIPLTPEILQACGFMKIQGKEDIYRREQLQLYHGLRTTMCYTRYNSDEYCYLGTTITYLHELQNLYFSLYKTELIYLDTLKTK
jgi:hypothetical protein